MIYPEQQGDYLPKSWNATEFDIQFDLLMDQEAFVATTEKGFIHLSFIEKIAEIFKNFIGGTDHSQKHRVQAAWLKFLYYGEAHGFLKDEQIERLRHRINYPYGYFDSAIEKMFRELKDYHQFATESKSEHLQNLRDIVTNYHHQHAPLLQPGFWTRLMISPSLNIKKLIFFGDTPLQLSLKALEQETPNPRLALTHLQKAFNLKNDSPDFQEKLAEQLQELKDSYSSELEGQKQKIQELWIELGQTAFENKLTDLAETYLSHALETNPKNIKACLQVGKLYLSNKEYDLAQPFLHDLQKSFPQDLPLQIEVGHAYWQTDKFEEAMEAYEAALNICQKQTGKFIAHHKSVASVYHQMGIAHLKKLISDGTLTKAISFLSEAVQTDSTVSRYQEDLCEAYAQEWKASNNHFATAHKQEWFSALNLLQTSVLQKNQVQILSMLMECSEQYFKAHQNQKAHACLKRALILFKNDANVKIQALDLVIRYGDCGPFQAQFNAWRNEHYADPYLKKKIGDAYWNSNKSEALEVYQESLNLFNQYLSLQDDTERENCQQHIADIQARIGQTHLQTKPSFFKNVPYDEAIQSLEKAAILNPKSYTSLLFDAYLAAAQAEKQKLWPDKNKMMAYYQKAFEVLHQQGEYLVELTQLYLDNQQNANVVALYHDIQKQPWAKKFDLSSAILNNLAKRLFDHKDYEAALDCLRRAYQLESQNQQYKQEYFQFTLTLAKWNFQNIQDKPKEEIEKEEEDNSIQCLLDIVKNLDTCWKEGADKINKVNKSYQETFVKIYGYLANCYVQRCVLPKPEKEMDKKDVKQHKELHAEDIQQALTYYDKALHYQPDNATLHFDKGLLLDWVVEFEEAFKEFGLAVTYQPCNPFYHKRLAPFHSVLYFDSAANEQHQKLAQKYASSNFTADYTIWSYEFMSQNKTKQIDPHSYTQKKGWFD